MTTQSTYKLSKLAHIIGALLVIISTFLPAVEVMGTAISFIGNPLTMVIGVFFIVLGVIIAVVGLVKKRWLHILSLILGLIILLLSFQYLGDAGSMIGIGLWVMLAGGIVSTLGAVFGLMKK